MSVSICWHIFSLTPTRKTSLINQNNIKMALNIKPLADRVLIEPAAAETKTASGIIIPDNAKEKPQQGKVMAVGKGTKDDKTRKKGSTHWTIQNKIPCRKRTV